MSPVTYENREGDGKIRRRELAVILIRRCSVPGKDHICFCIQRKGNVVQMKMFTQVSGEAGALLL